MQNGLQYQIIDKSQSVRLMVLFRIIKTDLDRHVQIVSKQTLVFPFEVSISNNKFHETKKLGGGIFFISSAYPLTCLSNYS